MIEPLATIAVVIGALLVLVGIGYCMKPDSDARSFPGYMEDDDE